MGFDGVFLGLNGVLWVQFGSLRVKVVRRGSLRFIWVK